MEKQLTEEQMQKLYNYLAETFNCMPLESEMRELIDLVASFQPTEPATEILKQVQDWDEVFKNFNLFVHKEGVNFISVTHYSESLKGWLKKQNISWECREQPTEPATKKEPMMKTHSGSFVAGIKNVPSEIPMKLLSEVMAQRNHNQCLSTLNSRGGLGVLEMLDNINNRKLSRRKEAQEDVDELNKILADYFSPVSQTTEEKLKSIISDKPSNWYEKALERKVKKLEAELSQTKGLDITDEEIDSFCDQIADEYFGKDGVNKYSERQLMSVKIMPTVHKIIRSLLSQSKQETETNK